MNIDYRPKSIFRFFSFIIFLSAFFSSVTVSAQERPLIKKLGTIDCDMVETSPIVYKNKLYRFEYVRANYKPNKTGKSYFRFVDLETGDYTKSFAEGMDFGAAYVENDTVYVSCVRKNSKDGESIIVYKTGDMVSYRGYEIFISPDWKLYNTSICKGDGKYVMAVEVGAPEKVVGVPFTMKFFTSTDLVNWTLMPDDCVYTKDRYSACPSIRYFDGWYYMVYLEEKPVPPGTGKDWPAYLPHIVRTKDFISWEQSKFNPILNYSDEDKKIANPALTKEQRKLIKNALDLNNSDVDFCEYKGKTIINYSWGDQHGVEFLAEAVYKGTLESFLKGFFPEK